MSSSIPCVLSANAAEMFLWVQWIPIFVSTAISAINLLLSGPAFFYAISMWLFLSHYTLYPFQAYFNMIRFEILCAMGQETYKFPSVEMYYVGAIATMVVVYTALWPTRTSYMKWIWVFAIFLAPAFVLVWFHFNVWYEVLFSFLWSVVMTTGFMLILRFFIAPAWPYIECVPPATWLGLHDETGWFGCCVPNHETIRFRLREQVGLVTPVERQLYKQTMRNKRNRQRAVASGLDVYADHERWWHILT